MSITNLQNKIFTITNPKGIDSAVNELRLLLGGLTWVSHPYHIAQRFRRMASEKEGKTGVEQAKKLYVYPEMYVGKDDKMPYHRLTPDNDYTGMFFFMVGKGEIEYNPNEYNFINYPVSIIFSVNLATVNKTKLKEYLFTQELIEEARRLLTSSSPNFLFTYKLLTETRDLQEVYREFILDDLEQYNRVPMQCFRIDLTLKLMEECIMG